MWDGLGLYLKLLARRPSFWMSIVAMFSAGFAADRLSRSIAIGFMAGGAFASNFLVWRNSRREEG